MAGVATHIRIAIGLKEKYRVKDIRKYITGTIYPDSRYVTGIDRSLTHPSDYLDWHWETADDFKKGWLVHLLVDEIQYQVEKKISRIFSKAKQAKTVKPGFGALP